MTDIPGVGWSGLWVYQGAGISGRITESYGLVPGGIAPRVVHAQLRRGSWGGRFGGGVPLPTGSHPGDRVRLGIQIATPDGAYGAQINFTLTRRSPIDITVSPLSRKLGPGPKR